MRNLLHIPVTSKHNDTAANFIFLPLKLRSHYDSPASLFKTKYTHIELMLTHGDAFLHAE